MSAHRRRRRASRAATPHVLLDRSRCEACWRCVKVCPERAIGRLDMWFHKHAVIVAADACSGCLRCVTTCPSGALSTRDAPVGEAALRRPAR